MAVKSSRNNLRAESRTRYLKRWPRATKSLYHNGAAHLVNEQAACKRLVDDSTRLAILRRMALPRKMGSLRWARNPLRGRGLRCSSSCDGSRQPAWSYMWRRLVPAITGSGHRAVAFDLLGY